MIGQADPPAWPLPLNPRTALVLFLTATAALVLGGLLVAAMDLGLWALAPVQVVALLTPPLLWAARAGVLPQAFPLKPLGGRSAWASALFLAGGSALALGCAVGLGAWLGESASERALREMLLQYPYPARFALFALAPALCEEVLFRGAILGCLRPWGKAAAISGSAALFAVLHLDPAKFLPVGLLGAAFAWVVWETGSLWPAFVGHCAHNGIVLALASAQEPLEAELPAALGVAAFLAVAGCALAALGARAFRGGAT